MLHHLLFYFHVFPIIEKMINYTISQQVNIFSSLSHMNNIEAPEVCSSLKAVDIAFLGILELLGFSYSSKEEILKCSYQFYRNRKYCG